MKSHLSWIKEILGLNGPQSQAEENADILLQMAEDGDDLSLPREIDFHHLFSSSADAVAFLEAVRGLGYTKFDHDFWQDKNAWLTAVHVTMVPVLEGITAIESELNEIADSCDGQPDGWGCMEVI